MKKQFLSVLAFSAILLSSCGGTAKMERVPACGQKGEITASSTVAVAETESGKVAGYVENGIYIYKGIPYAKAERFMPPVAVDKWEGVRSSRAYGPTCPQGKRMGWYSDEQAFAFNWDDGYPDENCLRVNIWTPGLKDGKKRPVMVWLHGGGYSAGSGQELPSYDGTNLAKKGDAVVVTLNHRLNVLGFLDLSAYGDKYAKSGNAGLLDLVAALQWVNKNIESFGGDARNVTIFGQSGGGGKVSTLLATPSARGLFHKAIVQSGSMLRTMEQKYSRRIGSAVMEELGLNTSALQEMLKRAMQESAEPEGGQEEIPEKKPGVDYCHSFKSGRIDCVTGRDNFYDEAMYTALYGAIPSEVLQNQIRYKLEQKAKEFGGTALAKMFNQKIGRAHV